MKIYLKNIGKVKEANIEIRGITVIGGENNTGKSTVGKALYSAFNSFVDAEGKLVNEKLLSIRRRLFGMDRVVHDMDRTSMNDLEILAEKIISLYDEHESEDAIKEELRSFFNVNEYVSEVDKERFKFGMDGVLETLRISAQAYVKILTQKIFATEFNQQINNILEKENGQIVLSIKGKDSVITIGQDKILNVTKGIDILTEAIYLDDPFIIDEIPSRFSGIRYNGHKEDTRAALYNPIENNLFDEIVAENRINKILGKINDACHGDIFLKNKNELMYKQENTGATYKVANLSTGLKSFAILQTLLLNGTIKDGGVIILDEPEIHLHPEWQLIFAELIIMLQKEFGLHILLNTHSPYFLQAIEVFAKTYGISDKCDYYLSYNKGNESYFAHVNGEVDKIYAKLARPLQVLEDLRFEYGG